MDRAIGFLILHLKTLKDEKIAVVWSLFIPLLLSFTFRQSYLIEPPSREEKDEPIEELHTAIRKVLRGEKVISPQLAISILDYSANPLSEREQEVLRLARTGISTKEIANSLYLTEGTVRNYLSSAIQKLDVDTRQNAVKIAEEKGWI